METLERRQVGRLSTVLGRKLAKRLDRCRLVVLHIKDGIELGDLQQIVHFLGEVEQLKVTALLAHGGESAYQFANARAVNVVNLGEVEENLLLTLAEQP